MLSIAQERPDFFFWYLREQVIMAGKFRPMRKDWGGRRLGLTGDGGDEWRRH
jgi:hypothetical protein